MRNNLFHVDRNDMDNNLGICDYLKISKLNMPQEGTSFSLIKITEILRARETFFYRSSHFY